VSGPPDARRPSGGPPSEVPVDVPAGGPAAEPLDVATDPAGSVEGGRPAGGPRGSGGSAPTRAPRRRMRRDGLPRHTLSDVLHERTHFRFIERSWRWAVLSLIVILAGMAGLALRGGLNMGIDFRGGTSWTFEVQGRQPSVSDIRSKLDSLGLADSKVLILGTHNVRVEAEELSEAQRNEVSGALADYARVEVRDVAVTDVSPTWGKTVSSKALQALVVFFLAIALYLTVRFEWKMALSALAAVVHDILVTVGVYALVQFEVTPETVIAFLTILGFSLYDTVVVFDKIRENAERLGSSKGETYGEMVNRSMNEVLMRSLNTTFVAVLPVLSILLVGAYLLGAAALEDFGLALAVGLTTGAYSSIFVATPLLARWKEREPRYRTLRERVASRGPRPAVAAAVAGEEPGAAAEGDGAGDLETVPATRRSRPDGVAGPPAVGRTSYGAVTPKPRKQRRRKR